MILRRDHVNHTEYDFNESLGVWLTVSTQAYHRRMEERLLPHEITFRQAQVVGWLMMSGQLAQTELARRMQVEPSTVVRLLDRMEEAGLIERCADPCDRRRHHIRVTEAVAPLWKQITVVARQVRKEAAKSLTVEEQATLKDLLQRVTHNLQSTLAPEPHRRTGKKVSSHD